MEINPLADVVDERLGVGHLPAFCQMAGAELLGNMVGFKREFPGARGPPRPVSCDQFVIGEDGTRPGVG